MSVEAATILLLRRVATPTPATLELSSALSKKARYWLGVMDFGERERLSFASGWQILLGQGEAQNYVKSTPEQPAVMRYPGEWKLPGGRREAGESLEQTAWRELREEFGVGPSSSAALHRFNVKTTKAVRGVSFEMHNFACLADECEWLRALEPEAVNEALLARRARFEALLRAGRFWDLPRAEREAVAPEVRRVAWLPLHEACQHLLSSCQSADEPLRPVDEWQRSELERLGVSKRDPMFQTLATLLEVSRFADEDALRRHCEPPSSRL